VKLKPSSVFIATASCSVIFSGYMFDHSDSQSQVMIAWIVAVLLIMISTLLAIAAHFYEVQQYREFDEQFSDPHVRQGALEHHHPHMAAFRERAGLK
jgi:hypothetical protein